MITIPFWLARFSDTYYTIQRKYIFADLFDGTVLIYHSFTDADHPILTFLDTYRTFNILRTHIPVV